MPRTILVTGGAGFIGSALTRQLIQESDARVVVLDALTYAADVRSLADVQASPRFAFEPIDVRDRAALRDVVSRVQPDAVVHLAAETHVDRSIDTPADFVTTNVLGTFALLESVQAYLETADGDTRARFRFVQVSSDEVYGSLGATGVFDQNSAYRPTSPYSATKASADHLARAWQHTYGLPVVVTNSSNNYGPFQFPEKLVPLAILKAIAGEPIPVYGRGDNVRDWLFVDDHARALRLALERGEPGATYLIGARCERTVLQVVEAVCEAVDARIRPGGSSRERIRFVEDRPGHDFRYALDPSQAERELGWSPRSTFDEGIRRTVDWYLERRDWWQPIVEARYGLERLGLGRSAAR